MNVEMLLAQVATLDAEERSRFIHLVQHPIYEPEDFVAMMEKYNDIAKNKQRWYTMDDLDKLIEAKEVEQLAP